MISANLNTKILSVFIMFSNGRITMRLLTDDLRAKVLSIITPTQSEIDRQQKTIEELTIAIASYASEHGYQYSFILPQGSTGQKQTQLRGASDIDLFIGIDPNEYEHILALPRKQRSAELDSLFDRFIKEWFIPALSKIPAQDMRKTYSQHPYLSASYMGSDVDVLVCFDIPAERIASEGPITAVDRTVHHSAYVASRLNTRLRDDVRVLKSFVRACHAYGDACAVGQMGFTGVSLELLVINQQGLEGALQRIIDLREKPLDPLGRSKKQLLTKLSFKDDFVFIIDPTDTSRNIASSFSERAYNWVSRRAYELLDAKGDETKILDMVIEKAIPTTPPPDWLIPHLFIFEVCSDESKHYTVNRDKLYRVCRRISREISFERTGEPRFGQNTFEILLEGTRFAIGFLVERTDIPHTYARRGPPVGSSGMDAFIAAHKGVYQKEGYLWVDARRKWVNVREMIRSMMTEYLPAGFILQSGISETGWRIANILYRVILPLERFPIKARV